MPEQEDSELARRSDDLLEALRRLKDAEERKRQEPISSDAFHRLANEVDALSHEVFAIAREQRDVGERTPASDATIDDVADRLEDERRQDQ
jgi:hypothetical protein